ncbi:MAG: type II secretion system F family protein [Planctomycetes bacterium]|nr:type II secretion system F family protein [Planctomycetota bacterium]
MPIFEYKAVDGENKSKRGIIDADSAREARIKLRQERLFVTDLKERQRRQRRLQVKGITGVEAPNKLRSEQVAAVTRQMASLLRSGIPLAEALRMVIEQSPDRKIEAAFRDIRERVTQGMPLADAVMLHPAYFTELYANMIRAGESAGALDQVMMRLSEFLQSQARLRNKVGAAMVYPTVMIIVGVLVVGVLMTVVVPEITKLIEKKNQELPLPTQVLIAVSHFLQTNWIWCLVAALGVVVCFQLFVNSERGRWIFDTFKLRMPIFGDLQRKQSVARFSTTLATLLRSGVPALQGLEITKRVVGNVVLSKALTTVHDNVLEGTDLATPMKMSGVFPPMVCYMVGVGEQAGNLEEMLERVAETYDEEVDVATQKLTSLIEPLVIVFLAAIVAGIVVAIVMPLMQLQKIK